MKIVSSADGRMAFVFTKHDLIAIKSGSILNAELVSGNQKVRCAFLRDNTFEREVKNFQKQTQLAAKELLQQANKAAETPEEVAQQSAPVPTEPTTNP